MIEGPSIPGVGPVYVNPEYTSKEVKDKYDALLKELQELFDKTGAYTEADVKKLLKIREELLKLVQVGDGKDHVTRNMADNILLILNIINSANPELKPGMTDAEKGKVPSIDQLSPKQAVDLMNSLRDYKMSVPGEKAPVTFSDIIGISIGKAVGEDLTLQGMLMTIFLESGLAYFEGKLEDMNKVLEVNQKIIDLLNTLKQYRNKNIAPPTTSGDAGYVMPDPNLKDYNGKKGIEAYIAEYGQEDGWIRFMADAKLFGSQNIANPIGPDGVRRPDPKYPQPPTITVTKEKVDELLKIREDLKKQIQELKDAGIGPSENGKDGNLADKLQAVLDDLDGAFSKVTQMEQQWGDPSTWNSQQKELYYKAKGDAAYNWLMDGQDQITGGKDVADHISNAGTAASTLNDNQKDKLNQTIYVFEQFQKITAAIITALHETIKKFATLRSSG